jgi:hypothetical protein
MLTIPYSSRRSNSKNPYNSFSSLSLTSLSKKFDPWLWRSRSSSKTTTENSSKTTIEKPCYVEKSLPIREQKEKAPVIVLEHEVQSSRMMRQRASTKLRNMIQSSEKIIVCPGVYDGLSARIAIEVGFEGMYMVCVRSLFLYSYIYWYEIRVLISR